MPRLSAPQMSARILSHARDAGKQLHEALSDREFDVFRRIAAGQTITEIAQQLCVSAKTVSTYKSRILEKMQMPHEAALVRTQEWLGRANGFFHLRDIREVRGCAEPNIRLSMIYAGYGQIKLY